VVIDVMDPIDGGPEELDFAPGVLIPVYQYAERHPSVPIITIVRCAVDVLGDPELLTASDGWLSAVKRTLDERLYALEGVEPILDELPLRGGAQEDGSGRPG
jgi:hypothetical protein